MALNLTFLGGRTEVLAGRRAQWQEIAHSFTWPALIAPQDAFLSRYNGKKERVKFIDVVKTTQKLLGAWRTYVLNNSATYAEYQTNLREFRSWYNTLRMIIAGSQSGNINYLASYYWKNLDYEYSRYEQELAAAGNAIAQRAQKAASKEQGIELNQVSEQAKRTALQYYDGLISNFKFIYRTTNVGGAMQAWEAVKTSRADEALKYENWKKLLTTKDLGFVNTSRRMFWDWYDKAFAAIRAKEKAKLQELQRTQPKATYAQVGITAKMRTGLWSQAEKERLEVTENQIRDAVEVLNRYTGVLSEALRVPDKKRAKQIFDGIVPKAISYANGVSAGVRDSLAWKNAVEKWNLVLARVKERLGVTNINWGLLLALGGAAVGGVMLLT